MILITGAAGIVGRELCKYLEEKNLEYIGLIRDQKKHSNYNFLVRDLSKPLNLNEKIDGYIVQLPLPKHINQNKVINRISPLKDVDGFSPINVGNLASGYNAIVPCTPLGCLLLLKKVEKNRQILQ